MKKETQDPNKFLYQVEQMEAFVKTLSILLGGYYQDLLKNGIPDDLARSLVMELYKKLVDGGNS